MQNGAERLAQKMEKGGFAVGFAVTLAEPALSEMAGCAGYDFVFVDAEHSPLDRRDVFSTLWRLRAQARLLWCGCAPPSLRCSKRFWTWGRTV